MKAQSSGRWELLYTDTDSLLLDIETENVYRDMAVYHHLYDTSEFRKNHLVYGAENKKVLGKIKDVCAGHPIDESRGFRPKMH